MLGLSIIILCLVILIIAAYVDIRILEVPDWLNFAGIAAGFGIAIIFSLQQWHWWPIASSAIGFSIAFGIACLMFYTGQWGGGDAKLLMAMGALIGFELNRLAFGTSFLINLVLVGGTWGVVWSAGLAAINGKKFWKTFKALRHHKPYAKLRIMTLVTAAVFIALSFAMATFQLELLGLAVATYTLCYLTIFVKSVELSTLHKWITPDKLTEGDWLVHSIKVGNKQVLPGKLGLDKKQVKTVKQLYAQKKIKKVLVKYGAPFAPAFLLAFIATLAFGNIILAII
jgi:Flp pilus assembly protein protease CpaA